MGISRPRKRARRGGYRIASGNWARRGCHASTGDPGNVSEGEGGGVQASRGDYPQERVVTGEVQVGIAVCEDDG